VYKRILVPVDGSRTAMLGLREAIRMAGSHGSRLRLLHVLDLARMLGTLMRARDSSELVAGLQRKGERALESARALAAKHRVMADSAVVSRPEERAAVAILEEAKRWNADLIVMGTHGRRGLNRILMGSDAELVVRSSPVPVLLVRATASGRRRP
jgi:nucleotide-binding universal stress UspA family protein